MDIQHTKRKKKPPPPATPAPTPLPREGTFNLRLTDSERKQLDAVAVAMTNERGSPVPCAEAIRRLIFDAYQKAKIRKTGGNR
jgi:hypothetical protein